MMSSIKKKIFLSFGLAFLLSAGNTFSQNSGLNNTASQFVSDPNIVSVATPQAASLGQFGRVPVDFFNGMANIDIPVYKLPVKGRDIDIRLSYHGGGVKPSEKGGIVGVGWSLITGGNITRIQNGALDELVNPTYSDSLLGYYWNRSQLNISNWDSQTAMNNFLNSVICQGCSGVSQWHDWAPDEFTFNVLGYSGSFWLDNNGNWQVRENNGEKLSISVTMAPYSYAYPTAGPVQVKYCLQKFRITDGEGNVFIFGNDANSIEFSRNATGDIWPATATSWYLSQIITSKGEKINYNYQRIMHSYSVFGSMNAYQALLGSNNYSQYNLQSLSGVIHDPVYLQNITYNNLSIQFNYSASNIFYYSNSPGINSVYGIPAADNTTASYLNTNSATFPSNQTSTPKPTDYKLDKIVVSYGSTYSRQFNFTYYDSTIANRLFLKTFSIGPITRPLVYQFAYNGTTFSNYADPQINDGILTTKVDHWGYYTGKFPFKTADLPQSNGNYMLNSLSYPPQDFITNYYANRQPNADSMKIGSLSSIIYPTGGYTNFVYEPHDYSSQINLPTNYLTTFLGSNYTAGGLRIKEVDSYADQYSQPAVKKYYYKNDNGYSSGVLNTAGVLYTDSVTSTVGSGAYQGQTFTYRYFYDNNLMPLQNSNGNHVTYSRVDEVSADGSRTVYRYTNHDNGHYDLSPSSYLSGTINAYYYMQPNSRNFQRGKLISQSTFDNNQNVVSKDTISYINDDQITSTYNGVRAYSLKTKDVKMYSFLYGASTTFQSASIWNPSLTPYVFYKHYYPSIQKTTTYYKSPDSLQTVETFTYNSNNNKLSIDSIKGLSDGSMKINTFNYPSDFSGNSFYSGMVNNNIIDPVILSTRTDQMGTVLMVNKDSLKANSTNNGTFYWPYEKDQYRVASNIMKTNILNYDSIGNPVNVIGPDGVPTCYLWNYSSIYPVAIVKNADNVSVAYTSFEAEGSGNWTMPDYNYVTTKSLTGLQSYALNSSKTITNSVTSGKQYILSYWARNGAAIVNVNAHNTAFGVSLTGPTRNGWTYYEHLLPDTTSTLGITASVVDTVDELRLFPVNAQMTTYTYFPLSGISTVCSPSNNITSYQWDDGLGRLMYISDMNGNVVKKFAYKYQQLAVPFYNVQKSGSFYKNNCDPTLQGSLVTYVVAANTYSSNISQTNADSIAQNDVNTNGQSFANATGTCGINTYGEDATGLGGGFIATYTGQGALTGQVYTFNVPQGGSPLYIGNIPQGRYSLTISKPGNTTSCTFTAGCSSLMTTGTSATFSLITVNTTSCGSYNLTISTF